MLRFERSARIARGKLLEARQWAQEVTDYANKNHPEGKLQVFSERFGNIGKLCWQADFDDLAALDRYQASFGSDQGYWALVNKSAELLVEDSVRDTVYETL
jgi:hypothetical protein